MNLNIWIKYFLFTKIMQSKRPVLSLDKFIIIIKNKQKIIIKNEQYRSRYL